jgi:hypothetical protein
MNIFLKIHISIMFLSIINIFYILNKFKFIKITLNIICKSIIVINIKNLHLDKSKY